jgi:hypothetical protein
VHLFDEEHRIVLGGRHQQVVICQPHQTVKLDVWVFILTSRLHQCVFVICV